MLKLGGSDVLDNDVPCGNCHGMRSLAEQRFLKYNENIKLFYKKCIVKNIPELLRESENQSAGNFALRTFQ